MENVFVIQDLENQDMVVFLFVEKILNILMEDVSACLDTKWLLEVV